MIRGTTPYYRFKLPISPNYIEEIYITFSQDGKTIVEKTLKDCKIINPSGNIYYHRVMIRLDQNETLMFDSDRYKVEVQMTIVTNTNPRERFSSRVRSISAGRTTKEEVV